MKANTYTYGNATVVVYRPELTEQEQKKHERQIKVALQQFGKAMSKKESGERI